MDSVPANATSCRMWLSLSKTLCTGVWDVDAKLGGARWVGLAHRGFDKGWGCWC